MCATGSGITLGEALALDFFVVRHLNNLLDPLFLVFNFMLIPKQSQVLEPGAQSEQPWNEGGSGRTRYPHIWTPRPALACSSLWSRRTYWKYRNCFKTFAERLLTSSISRDSSQNLRQQILVPKKSRAPVWPLSHQQPRSPESSLCRCHIDRSTTRREARSQYKDCLHWRCSPKEVARKLEGTLYWLAPSRVCNEASKPVQVGWFLVGSKNATRVWNPDSQTFEKPHQRPAHRGIAGQCRGWEEDDDELWKDNLEAVALQFQGEWVDAVEHRCALLCAEQHSCASTCQWARSWGNHRYSTGGHISPLTSFFSLRLPHIQGHSSPPHHQHTPLKALPQHCLRLSHLEYRRSLHRRPDLERRSSEKSLSYVCFHCSSWTS